jgi:hypothetical protein
MALREIEPLTDEDFIALTSDIEKGQSPEQEAAISKALQSKDVPDTDW